MDINKYIAGLTILDYNKSSPYKMFVLRIHVSQPYSETKDTLYECFKTMGDSEVSISTCDDTYHYLIVKYISRVRLSTFTKKVEELQHLIAINTIVPFIKARYAEIMEACKKDAQQQESGECNNQTIEQPKTNGTTTGDLYNVQSETERVKELHVEYSTKLVQLKRRYDQLTSIECEQCKQRRIEINLIEELIQFTNNN